MKFQLLAGALALGLAVPAAAQMGPMEPQTRDQFLAAQKAQFAALDADHDGVVTKDELSSMMEKAMGSAPPPEMIDTIYKLLDTNGDGKATAAESDTAAAERFAKWDADHNGTLSVEELQAGAQAMMAAMQGGQ